MCQEFSVDGLSSCINNLVVDLYRFDSLRIIHGLMLSHLSWHVFLLLYSFLWECSLPFHVRLILLLDSFICCRQQLPSQPGNLFEDVMRGDDHPMCREDVHPSRLHVLQQRQCMLKYQE